MQQLSLFPFMAELYKFVPEDHLPVVGEGLVRQKEFLEKGKCLGIESLSLEFGSVKSDGLIEFAELVFEDRIRFLDSKVLQTKLSKLLRGYSAVFDHVKVRLPDQ